MRIWISRAKRQKLRGEKMEGLCGDNSFPNGNKHDCYEDIMSDPHIRHFAPCQIGKGSASCSNATFINTNMESREGKQHVIYSAVNRYSSRPGPSVLAHAQWRRQRCTNTKSTLSRVCVDVAMIHPLLAYTYLQIQTVSLSLSLSLSLSPSLSHTHTHKHTQ